MNDEIKEILKDIEKGVKTGKDKNDIKVGGICYEWQDLKIVLDYITNLQEENERLKENNSNMQEEMARVWEENKRLNLELSGYREAILRDDKLLGLQDYKSRCEKAIEYIKQEDWNTEYDYNLLNILQNGSEENVK